MYATMRNLHLWLGLGFLLFLLMYAVSSVQMAHPEWFPMEPSVREEVVSLSPAPGFDPREVAARLREAADVRGDVSAVETAADTVRFRVVRPGTVHEVSYAPGEAEVRVRTSVGSFLAMLNRLHHVGGLWHDYALIDVWGALVGLVSLALVAIGGTGIYLWFRVHRERRVGAVLLALSLGYGLALVVLIRIA